MESHVDTFMLFMRFMEIAGVVATAAALWLIYLNERGKKQ